jgi:hypothetical protein
MTRPRPEMTTTEQNNKTMNEQQSQGKRKATAKGHTNTMGLGNWGRMVWFGHGRTVADVWLMLMGLMELLVGRAKTGGKLGGRRWGKSCAAVEDIHIKKNWALGKKKAEKKAKEVRSAQMGNPQSDEDDIGRWHWTMAAEFGGREEVQQQGGEECAFWGKGWEIDGPNGWTTKFMGKRTNEPQWISMNSNEFLQWIPYELKLIKID